MRIEENGGVKAERPADHLEPGRCDHSACEKSGCEGCFSLVRVRHVGGDDPAQESGAERVALLELGSRLGLAAEQENTHAAYEKSHKTNRRQPDAR